jgi:C4-dicarboxylate transporter, DctM subunit
MGLVIFLTLIVLIAINTPIAFAIGLAALAAVFFSGDLPLGVIPQRIFVGLDNFPLLAAPLFIVAGEIMNSGAMSDRLVKFANALLGHVRGSLAMVTVVTSMFFAGVSGSATADTAAVGSILIPAMIRRGYKGNFATALQACAGSIGPIIPPSVVMVIYGWVAGVSVGALFLGGVIPGFLIGAALMVTSYLHARGGGEAYLGGKRAPVSETMRTGLAAVPALGMPVIILGGIIAGVFTPTEAAAIAVFYALLVELIIYRDIPIRGVPALFINSAIRSTVVMLVVGMAALLGWMITFSGLPDRVGDFLVSVSPNKYVLLFMLNILFLVIGTFMEAYAAIILLVPLLLPAVHQFGIDPIHFGVIVTVNLCIGMVTPPLGVTLFVGCSISGERIANVLKPLAPMLLGMIAVLFLITYVPWTVTYLPSLFR